MNTGTKPPNKASTHVGTGNLKQLLGSLGLRRGHRTPHYTDPKCRPWGAKEAARRAAQAGHDHAVGQGLREQVRAGKFREEKAIRRAVVAVAEGRPIPS